MTCLRRLRPLLEGRLKKEKSQSPVGEPSSAHLLTVCPLPLRDSVAPAAAVATATAQPPSVQPTGSLDYYQFVSCPRLHKINLSLSSDGATAERKPRWVKGLLHIKRDGGNTYKDTQCISVYGRYLHKIIWRISKWKLAIFQHIFVKQWVQQRSEYCWVSKTIIFVKLLFIFNWHSSPACPHFAHSAVAH